jgi:hypothetical protein
MNARARGDLDGAEDHVSSFDPYSYTLKQLASLFCLVLFWTNLFWFSKASAPVCVDL